MTDAEVLKSLDNAWKALAVQYKECPDDGIRCGMNLLAKIISKVESEVREGNQEGSRRREGQVTIDEWLAMLREG